MRNRMSKKHQASLLSFFIMGCLLLTACEADPSIDHSSKCSFTFSYDDFPTSQIFVAAQNPGSYVFVSTKGDGKNTMRHVYVTSNYYQSPTEDNIITNAIYNNLNYLLGSTNEIGLIIGCSNFNGLRAYDRCCPNCTTLRALQWTGNYQKVVCNSCKRVYDLETATISEGDKGSSLRRYNCMFNGTALNVWN